MSGSNPFRYFNESPEIIRLAVMLYIRFPLTLRNDADLLHERGIGISHKTVRYWWNRFGRCSPPRSAAGAWTECGRADTGAGTRTRSRLGSTA